MTAVLQALVEAFISEEGLSPEQLGQVGALGMTPDEFAVYAATVDLERGPADGRR
jgi:hypothetical protein